jgi:hypothetical protein
MCALFEQINITPKKKKKCKAKIDYRLILGPLYFGNAPTLWLYPTQNILRLQGIGGGFLFLVLKCELGFLHLLPLTPSNSKTLPILKE